MKTAIEQVIDHLEKQIVKSVDPSARRTGDYRIGITHSIEFCNAFIEIEKQQIRDAFVAGSFEGYKGAKGHPFTNVNDYINLKYTENETNS